MTSITCYGSYLCINFRFPLHDKFWNVAKADSKGCWMMMLQKRDVNSPKRLLKKKAFEVKMICCHQESILLWTKRGPAEMDSRLFQNIGNPFYERIGGKEEEDRIDLQSLYRYRLRWSQSDMSIKINLTLLLLLNPSTPPHNLSAIWKRKVIAKAIPKATLTTWMSRLSRHLHHFSRQKPFSLLETTLTMIYSHAQDVFYRYLNTSKWQIRFS